MNYDDLIQYLRARGHRLTPQRRLTLAILQQNNHHLSADEIARQITAAYPSIGVDIATIYRTLKWLREIGLVSEMSLGQGPMVYALLSRHLHHHLVCDQCAVTFEIDSAIFDVVRNELRERYGFTARLDHLSIFGLCAVCRMKATVAPSLFPDLKHDEMRQ